MNETIQTLMGRRSIRSFADRPIEETQRKAIQEATLRAPTAGNMALYSVIEIEDREEKEKLAVLCDNQPMIAKAPMVWIFLADMQKWVTYYREDGCEEKTKVPWREPGFGDLHLCLQDAVIAAQNAVVAAQSLGIGSCYIGDILEHHEEIASLLSLERYTLCACMLIFGYPKGKLTSPVLTPRCPVDSVFMENRYRKPHLKEMQEAYAEHEAKLKRQRSLPLDNTGSIADFYYLRKHTTSFMKEMNRSVACMFDAWKKEPSPTS